MPKTVADAFSDARTLLQDTGADGNPVRYPDADLIAHFNTAMAELRRLRPDAFFGGYEADLPAVAVGDDLTLVTFPVDEQFFSAVVFYMTGMAELRDDEFAVDGRAVTMMQQFTARVTGGDVFRWQRSM